MAFKHDRNFQATGWLMSNDTIVTSGHAVIDEDGSHLVGVKVIVGNTKVGREKWVGTRVIVSWGWFSTFKLPYDLALIRVEKPFKTASPFIWNVTPTSPNVLPVQILGFPVDVVGMHATHDSHIQVVDSDGYNKIRVHKGDEIMNGK